MSTVERALKRAALMVAAATAFVGFAEAPAAAGGPPAGRCDTAPTGVATSEYPLPFTIPANLMPDRQFDRLHAKLRVHRVKPEYAHGRCGSVPSRAVVLIHGRTAYGPAVFDLRQPAPEGGDLSVQKSLAQAGIDTFAPDLIGFGESTRFENGLDDPGNASLRPFENGTCQHPEGCDFTHVPVFPLDQQGNLLFTNPLGEQRREHSSKVRFATVDTFVRDIRQVIDDAIGRAHPSDGKVTLLGYSAGGVFVGRTLYAANPNPLLPNSASYIAKVNRVVFVESLFDFPVMFPTEQLPPTSYATFPLHVFDKPSIDSTWQMAPDREAACTGHVVPGSQEQLWQQILDRESVGLGWGGDVAGHPTGLARSPVFSTYGWNPFVAGQVTPPALVIQGADDQAVPAINGSHIYNALPSATTNKVLVQVKCASHASLFEGCSGPRCGPSTVAPYGGTPGVPWAGPHSTVNAALIEWITKGKFNGASSGQFTVNEDGTVP